LVNVGRRRSIILFGIGGIGLSVYYSDYLPDYPRNKIDQFKTHLLINQNQPFEEERNYF